MKTNPNRFRLSSIRIKKGILLMILIAGIALIFTGCIPGDGAATTVKKAGFFWGIWHGWVAPVSLIISIFDKNITIYEVNNTGFFYNFGYYMAIISGFGGIALKRRRKTQVRVVNDE